MSIAKTIATVSGCCRSDLSNYLTKTVVTDGFLLQPGSDIIRVTMDLMLANQRYSLSSKCSRVMGRARLFQSY
jgi:hypothetical protein